MQHFNRHTFQNATFQPTHANKKEGISLPFCLVLMVYRLEAVVQKSAGFLCRGLPLAGYGKPRATGTTIGRHQPSFGSLSNVVVGRKREFFSNGNNFWLFVKCCGGQKKIFSQTAIISSCGNQATA